jgi:hypothetical protein
MGINLNNGYQELIHHLGHEISCVTYGQTNVALECETCAEILIDFNQDLPGNDSRETVILWLTDEDFWNLGFNPENITSEQLEAVADGLRQLYNAYLDETPYNFKAMLQKAIKDEGIGYQTIATT